MLYKRHIKKTILLVGIIIVGIGCNNEQKKMDKMTNKLLTKITNACQLTPDQADKIKPLTEHFIELRKETKDKYSNDRDALKSAMEVNRSKFLDSLQTILTPDQFEKLKTSFQQQKAKQNGQAGDQQGGGQD